MFVARWNGAVIARSPGTILIENNHYFPPESLERKYFEPSNHHTTCFWKGEASYYDLVVNGRRNPNAAWYYPKTTDAAKAIEGYVAFWHGVTVEEVSTVEQPGLSMSRG